MAEPLLPLEPARNVTVNHIRWQSVLEFTHLFRGFRLAMNPAKLLMALLAILLVYMAGRAFDLVWGPQAAAGEIQAYQTRRADEFRMFQEEFRNSRSAVLARELEEASSGFARTPLAPAQAQQVAENPRAAYRLIKQARIQAFHEQRRANLPRAEAAEQLARSVRRAQGLAGRGIFDEFLRYEITQFDALVDNTLVMLRLASPRAPIEGGVVASGGLLSKNPESLWRSDTVLGCMANMTITAPLWMVTKAGPMSYRPVSADASWAGWLGMLGLRAGYLLSLLAFALVFMASAAYADAVICRLTALELSGQERPPLRNVLRFAARKFWTFFITPMVPFALLIVAGLLMTACTLIGAIPYVGEIVIGLVFFLLLGGGFVLMLLALGMLGGFNLLYPTIAVEGSDTFDAMSRAFAYVYARPWRLVFYTLLLLVYGVITLLFLGFAIYLLLALTHVFVGWGMSLFGAVQGAYSGLPKLETIWPTPHFNRLAPPVNWWAMSWSEYIGSLLIHFWVYLLVGVLGAYVITYYHSSYTVLYLLLRRSVEGQALTEIEPDEEAKVAAAPAPVTPAPAADAAPPA